MEKFSPSKKRRIRIEKTGRKGTIMSGLPEHKRGLPPSLDGGFDRMSQVMFELDQLKRQSKRLDLINQLHTRLAGVLNISGMVEAYSIWLMPIVEHELIGYYNYTKKKKILCCSGHGPNRRRAIAFAERVIKDGTGNYEGAVSLDGQLGHKWIFETLDDASILLILIPAFSRKVSFTAISRARLSASISIPDMVPMSSSTSLTADASAFLA